MTDSGESEETAARPKRIKLDLFLDVEILKKDLNYSLTDLSAAMCDQASLFAHYGVLAARAQRQLDDLELLLKSAQAKIDRKLRDHAKLTGDKLTEAQIAKKIDISSDVLVICRAINEARQVKETCKIAAEAFKHRREMLVSEGMIKQQELKGDVSIKVRRDADVARQEMRRRVAENVQKLRPDQDGE